MYILTLTDISGDSDAGGSSIGGVYGSIGQAREAMQVAVSTLSEDVEADDIVWTDDRMSCVVDQFEMVQLISLEVNTQPDWIPLG